MMIEIECILPPFLQYVLGTSPTKISYATATHGQKSLTGYSQCGHKESDRTE